MSKTLANLRDEALTRLGDTDNVIWSDTEIEDYIKEAYDELVASAKALWDQDYINDIAGYAVHSLPSDLVLVDRVVWDARTLVPISLQKLALHDARYETTEGTVDAYVVDAAGPGTIRKYRVPAVSATSTKAYNLIDTEEDTNTRVEYFRYGADLDSNVFECPDHWTRHIRHYAMWHALDREGPGQDLEIGTHYKMRWEVGKARVMGQAIRVHQTRVVRLGGQLAQKLGPRRPRLPWEYARPLRMK